VDFPALAEVAKPQVSRAAEILTIAADIGRELDRPDDLTPSVVEAQCVQLLGWVVRRSRGVGGPDDRSLTRHARTLIEGRQGGQIRVETLAQELNVSRHRLNRAFARTMGCSTGNYLRRLRLLEARRLLEETRIPIAQIALLTGFSDQSHLTRQCQAVFGRTPAQLRGQAVAESSTAEAGFDRAKLPNCASMQD
jgi:AraC family transcriptional regulator